MPTSYHETARRVAGEQILEPMRAGLRSGLAAALTRWRGEARELLARSLMHMNAMAVEALLGELRARRLEGLGLCVIYVDGMVYGQHHVIGAVGVDGDGFKHVLGVQDGAPKMRPPSRTCCMA